MINDIILLKQGEIVLKGLNRRSFEQKLMSNIKRRLAAIGKFKVYCMQSTVYIEPVDETSDMDAAFEAMTKVFGLASVNRAAGCEKDAKRIAELAIEYLRDDMLAAKSFKAEAKRGDKSFPMTSIELAQFVGGELAEAIGITQANLSILKTNKGKAIRFSTLDAICKKLNCTPGDILEYVEDNNGAE